MNLILSVLFCLTALSEVPDESQFITRRFVPFNVGLTYSEKIGINAELNLYLPRTGTFSPYHFESISGPFFCANLGWRASGIGLGYGAFMRPMGTIGANAAMKIFYSYKNSRYLESGHLYFNAEAELILMVNDIELGYLKPINVEGDRRNFIYFGYGVKF
ncbi:hypothetical protein JXA84_08800 [candidate division WOR-3 bacterium]|nr:hypothetical protein [candidate division WOR-3 bacterium]